jgi:hypothetical protein
MRALAPFVTCMLALALALAYGAVPAGAVSETKEEQPAYEQQLASGQIASVTINKRLRRAHVTLKDGRHFLYRYPPKQEPAVAAALRAKGVSVIVLKPSAAVKEEKEQPKKHKIRYIAGGALLAIVVIVGVVLLVRRRQRMMAE